MNLQELKYKLSDGIGNAFKKAWFVAGFDACDKLELPLLFAEWVDTDQAKAFVGVTKKDLYKYWITNIYNKD